MRGGVCKFSLSCSHRVKSSLLYALATVLCLSVASVAQALPSPAVMSLQRLYGYSRENWSAICRDPVDAVAVAEGYAALHREGWQHTSDEAIAAQCQAMGLTP